jgi:hypothetical protein
VRRGIGSTKTTSVIFPWKAKLCNTFRKSFFLSNCDAKLFLSWFQLLRKNTKDFPHFHFFISKHFHNTFSLSFLPIFFRGWYFFLPHINSLCAPRYESDEEKKNDYGGEFFLLQFLHNFSSIFFEFSIVIHFNMSRARFFHKNFPKFHWKSLKI